MTSRWVRSACIAAVLFCNACFRSGGTTGPDSGESAAAVQDAASDDRDTSPTDPDAEIEAPDAAVVDATPGSPEDAGAAEAPVPDASEPEGPAPPDAVCLENFPAEEACARCVCTTSYVARTPTPGCLESFQLCYENSDVEFTRLCSELTACARASGCTGAGCLAPCQAEIVAAAEYRNGGGLAACSSADPLENPCAAAAQALWPCIATACSDACP